MSESRPAFGQTDVVYYRDEEASARLLEDAIGGLWEVVNQLTRFRRTKRENYRVTIFGSARLQPGSPTYEAVKQLAAELTAMGCDIVTGGGPGLMQAANEGAVSVDPKALERSVGIRVDLPFEQGINPFVGQRVRAPHVLLALAPIHDRVGRLRRRARRHRHAARDVAGVAAAPGAQALRDAADPGRQDVGRVGRMGPPIDAP